jgi:hypothetical protein
LRWQNCVFDDLDAPRFDLLETVVAREESVDAIAESSEVVFRHHARGQIVNLTFEAKQVREDSPVRFSHLLELSLHIPSVFLPSQADQGRKAQCESELRFDGVTAT